MKLALGTAQFGLEYGVYSPSQPFPLDKVKSILALAGSHDITMLDTAACYGTAEQLLGEAQAIQGFDIVSKFLDASAPARQDLSAALTVIFKNLGANCLYGLLVHDFKRLLRCMGDDIVQFLEQCKQQGKIKKWGVSVYNKADIDVVLEKYQPDIIQLPINVFDQRLLNDDYLQDLHEAGVEIHARSIFLQGLLLMPLTELPSYFAPFQAYLNDYHSYLNSQGVTPLCAALNFVKHLGCIDKVIIGVNSQEQLGECIEAYNIDMNLDYAGFAIDEPALLDPTQWRLK